MERAEQAGVGIALLGHVALFGLLSVGFPATPDPLRIERAPVEVTFAEDVGLERTAPVPSRRTPATSMAPELGTPMPAAPREALGEPEVLPLPEPPAPAPAARPAPKAAPQEAVPQAPPKGRPKAPPGPAPAAAARGARLGPDFLKGLTETATISRAQEPTAPKAGTRVQAALASELKRQLKPHWRPPSGADIEKLRVVVVANLSPDGNIVGEPRVIGPTGVTASNSAQANLFVERAVAAVRRAAPYQLPRDHYASWKTIRPQLYEGL